MTNYGSKILNNSVSGLNATQAAIATIGNNIANVNTAGYTRRTAELETRPGQRGAATGVDIGNGVQVSQVTRASDQYLEELLRNSISTKSQDELKNDYLARIDAIFDISGTNPTIGSSLNSFFDAINQLSLNPSSIELRANVIQRGADLTNIINQTYNTIAATQKELDSRLSSEIDNVNSLATQIAEVNAAIGQREAAGGVAADQRDQRDQLLNKLSEKTGFNMVEDSKGMVTITLDNGFPLVNGTTSRSLALTVDPNGTSTTSSSLGGEALQYIVYNYGTSAFDLTNSFKNAGGTIAGILQLRGTAPAGTRDPFLADGSLVAVASRVEAFTRQLLTEFNQEYLGGSVDEDTSTTSYDSRSIDLDGNRSGAPFNPFALFDFTYSGIKDGPIDGRPQGIDLINIVNNTSSGITNFSSIITMAFTDPRRFAAALDLDATNGVLVGSPGDGSNAQALLALRSRQFDFTAGNFTLNDSTYDEAFSEMVTYVGNTKSAAALNAKVSADSYVAAATRRDEVAAVSLDEEFTKLIQFQKSFQASARMVKIADELLQQIVGLI